MWKLPCLSICCIFVLSFAFLSNSHIGLHGTALSFNQLQKRGHLQFPDASVKLPSFGRPTNIPQIKFPAAFISASTRSKMEAPLETNGTTMVEVVNMVMNNIEDYLPDSAIDVENERLGACSPVVVH